MATPAQQAANDAARKAAQKAAREAGGRSPLLRLAPFHAYADPVCALKDRRLVELHEYWRGKRQIAPIPARGDIHPRDFKPHLPRVFMIDALPDGSFAFRLAGTALVDLFGCEPTGKSLSTALGPQAARLASAVFTAVVEYGRPMRTLGAMDWWTPPERASFEAPAYDLSHMTFEAVHLPLSPDGAAVDMILCALVAYSGEDQPQFPEIGG